MPERFTKPADVFRLKIEEIDNLDSAVLRDALKSVLRDPGQVAYHKDHRSHSNVPSQVEDIASNPVRP
jgi:hypothetical protein